jgi:hypothetical protein
VTEEIEEMSIVLNVVMTEEAAVAAEIAEVVVDAAETGRAKKSCRFQAASFKPQIENKDFAVSGQRLQFEAKKAN